MFHYFKAQHYKTGLKTAGNSIKYRFSQLKIITYLNGKNPTFEPVTNSEQVLKKSNTRAYFIPYP